MAMRLGVTPTLHLSCRLRLLRLESSRQFSPSCPLLVRLPIWRRNFHFPSHSSVPRIGLWRRSIVAISSGPFGEGEDATDAGKAKSRRSVAYDLSSGFLQTRRQTEKIALRNLAQDDDVEDWEKPDDDYLANSDKFVQNRRDDSRRESLRYRQDNNRNSKRNILSSSEEDDVDGNYSLNSSQPRSRGIRSTREEGYDEDSDEEFGNWTGSKEPSQNFKKSSLYKKSAPPSDDDVKPQQGTGSIRYSPLPPSSGAASKPARSSGRKLPRSNPNPSLSSSTIELSKVESDVNNSSGGTDFIPPVIKPELPYQYSYTETPKVAPVGFREPVYSPFGPEGVNRPWTGRPPLAKSKKKPREFDSFNPPPIGRKGVKPVQAPGPYPEGQGPKLGRSREEILGAPLTSAEVRELVTKARKEPRQINLGRDGLTHNMLNLVHEHWKRRRVCKVKCKGVPTVDMDNVCRVLEEKTGGKIILRQGGAVYLFRGRNYNYKTRPVIPLMLWKPPAPIYPKLIEKAPAGLTIEEANNLRKLGRELPPVCHLGKNGVYVNLVRDVRNAFKVDDLVKVDCKNMNPSDYKKIGAKLKDLVPCVLLSFERESILMWRGPESLTESSNSVQGDSSGEAQPDFNQELPEDGQELLGKTLLNEGSQILDFSSNEDEELAMYETDTDTDEDQSLEAAYDSDIDESSIDVDQSFEAEYEHDDEHGYESLGGNVRVEMDPEVEKAVREFESLYQGALDSEQALVLEESELDPDTLLQVVKSRFGGAFGAPAKYRSKRNRNEVVGRKALLRASQTQTQDSSAQDDDDKGGPEEASKKPLKGLRLDPAVLDRVPKDPSGLLQVDELAKLLAP